MPHPFQRRNNDRAENNMKSTKPELIKLNSMLAADNEILRNALADKCAEVERLEREARENIEALARLAVQPIVEKIKNQQVRDFNTHMTLQARAQALAKHMHVQTRVRADDIEVYIHGGWNPVSTVAVPTHIAG